MSKIYLPGTELSLAIKRLGFGLTSLGRNMPRSLKVKHGGFGDTFFIDEVFIEIDGKQYYLW